MEDIIVCVPNVEVGKQFPYKDHQNIQDDRVLCDFRLDSIVKVRIFYRVKELYH
jgi:hypothetical protein